MCRRIGQERSLSLSAKLMIGLDPVTAAESASSVCRAQVLSKKISQKVGGKFMFVEQSYQMKSRKKIYVSRPSFPMMITIGSAEGVGNRLNSIFGNLLPIHAVIHS